MKHTVSMITALLLAPLAALHAAETTNVQLDGGRCLKVNGKDGSSSLRLRLAPAEATCLALSPSPPGRR